MELGRQSAVFVWTDRALFLGDRSETSRHSHHALELCVALDDLGIDMSTHGGPDLRGVPGAMVRAGAWHQLAIPGPKVAVLYLEPQSKVAASLQRWLDPDDIRGLLATVIHDLRGGFRELLESRDSGMQEAEAACAALVASCTKEAPRPSMHWRVRRAMERVDKRRALHLVEDGLEPAGVRHAFGLPRLSKPPADPRVPPRLRPCIRPVPQDHVRNANRPGRNRRWRRDLARDPRQRRDPALPRPIPLQRQYLGPECPRVPRRVSR